MRVVHIAFQYGTCNTGGAAIASTRLHRALLARGIDSYFICCQQKESGDCVYELPIGWRRKVFFMLTKFTRCIWKFTPYRRSVCLNVVPLFGLGKLLQKIAPDVVHVQWLGSDACSYEQIASLPYKMVFHLHDLSLINAMAPHPGDDRRFVTGFSRSTSSALERWMFNRKRRMVCRVNPTFIAPSRWVSDQCRASIIGRGHRVFECSNLLDPVFEAREQGEKRQNTRFVILFGAYRGRSNQYKGFDDLIRALRLLPQAVKDGSRLEIFGETDADGQTEGVETHFIGEIVNPTRLREVYRGADLFVFPSKLETQGMAKIEALACGTPVVVFDRAACAEGVEHGIDGWVAKDGCVEEFARGIEHYYGLWKSDGCVEKRGYISSSARQRFSSDKSIAEILHVYEELMH